MGSSDSFVKFDKVDKSYDGETLVVKDLNVDIPQGRISYNARAFWFWKNNYINDVSWI